MFCCKRIGELDPSSFVGLVTKAVCGFVPSLSLEANMEKSSELSWFLNTLQGNGHD
jgi:hypothetical protein